MKLSLQHVLLSTFLVTLTGCSFTGGNFIPVADDKNAATSVTNNGNVKYAATLRVNSYTDQRQVPNPRYIGRNSAGVAGLNGREMFLERDVTDVATAAIKQRFDAGNFQVLEGEETSKALFEVSGVIRELSLNVDNRDEISITIETTLTDAVSGKVVWSGLVTEKNNRFAGVSGNDKEDVAAYLKKGLRIVNDKTVAAISTALMASRPELFALTPGTKPIAGVGVLIAPPASPLAAQAAAQVSNPATGLLSVQTNPSRAKVYLDGVYFGLTPLRSEIEPGVHDVVVKHQGYKTATEKVSVRKGDNTELELSLDQ
ncbi:MAG TPA: PEGA domain-containing protein [Gallionella sp.]